ncbi:hypothetical protein M9Y10_034309 [Tritrichomonas musculus]|uniref:Uncharacterized protein n=1 Tax=Tritrichomonas musculus TaxID=1915356 RepID=A0ABR2KEJ6_9EUKA
MHPSVKDLQQGTSIPMTTSSTNSSEIERRLISKTPSVKNNVDSDSIGRSINETSPRSESTSTTSKSSGEPNR